MSETTWLERMRSGFRKTSDRLGDNLTGLFTKASLDAATLDEIEEALIASDLGPRDRGQGARRGSPPRSSSAASPRRRCARWSPRSWRRSCGRSPSRSRSIAFPRPQVILVVGVNGSGKTTTIAKLAHLFQEQDYSVLLAAGDTFRAAAIEQLQIWADRAGVPIIAGPEGRDSSAIVYDGVKKATAEGIDVLIVDTAGRLQNKKDLMDELAKIRRVLGRLNPAAPHDVVLVLDATTGQNALSPDRGVPRGGGRHRPGHDQAGRHRARRRAGRRGREIRPAHPRHRRRRGDGRPAGPSTRPWPRARSRERRHDPRDRQAARATPPRPGVGATLAIDYGPLLLFFLTNFFAPVPARAQDLRRDRRLHGGDDVRDAGLAAALPHHLADAVVFGDHGGDLRRRSPSGCTTRPSSRSSRPSITPPSPACSCSASRPAATCSRSCSAPLIRACASAAGCCSPATGSAISSSWRSSTRRSGARRATDTWVAFKLWLFLPGDLPVRRRQRADAAPARPRRRDARRCAPPIAAAGGMMTGRCSPSRV